MTLLIKHKFVSSKPDAADTSIVRPSNWNDSHEFTGVLGIANGGTGASSLGGVKAAIGLGNVDDTSDANKPISTATQAALDLKSGLNLIINGNFQINQRAFAGGALAAGTYGWDRWKAGTGGATATVSGYVVTLSAGSLSQVIEPAAWGSSSLASTAIAVSVEAPSASVAVTLGSSSGTITAGSGRRSVTITTGAGDAGNLTLTLAPASGTVSFGRVRCTLGADTSWVARPVALEIALCQRYFSKSLKLATAPSNGASYAYDAVFGIGGAFIANNAYGPWCVFPARMRAPPTIAIYRTNLGTSAGRPQYLSSSGWVDAAADPTLPAASETGFLLQFTGTFAAGDIVATTFAYTASAEL